MRGKADLGLANARAWDTQSITSFQALQTPFLITDIALAKAVATSTIATRMLDSITEVGVVGLTLWPEDLHHPVSLLPGTALLSPDDFSGLTVYTPSSGVSQALLRAFGANPTDLINNIQAAETGLRWGNSLLTPATATGNVTFFPDFRVLFANRLALELLSDEQLAVLHQAATAMQKKAIADQPGELQAGLAWCEKGGTIVLANAQQLADFEGAALPVREMIKEDALNAEFIAAILELKEKVEPSPGAAACKPPGAQPGLNP
jgi:TRAP-type C4-dicarboxylate transport system substrate-binding protein